MASPLDKVRLCKDAWVEFSLRSNVNAYAKIFVYKDNACARILWLGVLLAALSLTAWLLASITFTYLAYGTLSQLNVVYEMPTQFPAVTICSVNALSTWSAYWLVIQTLTVNPELSWAGIGPVSLMQASAPSFGDEQRRQLGLSVDQISCTYNNTDCTDSLHWYIMKEYFLR